MSRENTEQGDNWVVWPDTDLAELPWRAGRHVGRTLYAQPGSKPTDQDPMIGVMDTWELAAAVVEDHNAKLARS